MEILLAQPRGFCAGVVRAVDIVDRALDIHGAPGFVFHEIVHNRHVVDDLRRRGAIFVDEVESVPVGAVIVFSAHGVARAVVAAAQARSLRIIDATCPLVAKVHGQAQRYARLGRTVIMIGHRGHEEVDGTLGSVDGPILLVSTLSEVAALPEIEGPVAYVTQTTLSVDDTRDVIAALRRRYPEIEGPDVNDICYATQNRQNSARELAATVDLVLVVGARNSSNSNRLREVASQTGVPAWLIEDASQIEISWLAGARRVGVTAGASAPEHLVVEVTARLMALGAGSVMEMPGLRESVSFRLPDEVSDKALAAVRVSSARRTA